MKSSSRREKRRKKPKQQSIIFDCHPFRKYQRTDNRFLLQHRWIMFGCSTQSPFKCRIFRFSLGSKVTWSSRFWIQSSVYALAGVSVESKPQSISCEPVIATINPIRFLYSIPSNNSPISTAKESKVMPIMARIERARINGRRRPSFDWHLNWYIGKNPDNFCNKNENRSIPVRPRADPGPDC